ncbi:sugar transferase [Micromonospora profundi]|uniref:Sugar transferase n=1 Tax=Micromonospora profundi TaxID=1420889 RepID=A0AAJ6HWS2_9ACTN|nr:MULTISPECIES: exopolysaccharide biosynthesis polyprenyl glycosylphosphotransferase [Micromonospora]NJC14381.1 exopolysaccharide biosynthesis polyprenyl glycosylphosphotransferase [Micromonospora profundi]WLS45938.1 sugar transferase [Micromonospora profundi]
MSSESTSTKLAENAPERALSADHVDKHQGPTAVDQKPDLDTTTVLPYASSRTSKRTNPLRAWMLAVPVDLAALLAPLLVNDQRYWRGTLAMACVTVVIFAVGGLYRPRRHLSILDELPSLSGRLLASASIIAIIAATRHDSATYLAGFMHGVALSVVLVILGRALTRTLVMTARRRRWVEHNAIVIGGGPIGVELARLLRRYPQYGLRYVGCVDTVPRGAGIQLAGSLDDLEYLVRLQRCDVLILADPASSESTVMEVLRRPLSAACDLWAVPRLWGSRSAAGNPDHIGAIPIVKIGDTTLSGPRWALKRAFDVAFASLSLVVLSPVMLLCAIAVLLESGGRGGIFFHQERIGRHGNPFQVIKFRSMRPVNEHESQTNWSIAHDKRVGPVGRLLRRTSLDELPQLWNIVRGDMSVVGPRPERPYFVEKFSAEYPTYAMRHRVPVGLTGLAQVSGLRGDTPISDRARFDNYYIENWSPWLDVKVLLRTVAEVFRAGGR